MKPDSMELTLENIIDKNVEDSWNIIKRSRADNISIRKITINLNWQNQTKPWFTHEVKRLTEESYLQCVKVH